MRILLLNRYYIGGQTTHVDALAGALHDLGHQVTLGILSSVDCGRIKKRILWATRDRKIPVSVQPNADWLYATAPGVHPDIIHAHSGKTWPIAYKIKEEFGLPYMLTAHGPGLDTPINYNILSQSSGVICAGRQTKASLRSISPEDLHVISNGIDVKHFTPGKKSQRVRIVYIGRIDDNRRAGYYGFLDAVRNLEADIIVLSNVRPPSDYENIRFLGWKDDPSGVLKTVDIACCVGRSLMEAMACGAATFVLGQKYHGLVTPKAIEIIGGIHRSDLDFNDLPAMDNQHDISIQLRKDLDMLISNPAMLQQIQDFSRKFAETRFDILPKAEKHLDLYQKALQKQSPIESK